MHVKRKVSLTVGTEKLHLKNLTEVESGIRHHCLQLRIHGTTEAPTIEHHLIQI